MVFPFEKLFLVFEKKEEKVKSDVVVLKFYLNVII